MAVRKQRKTRTSTEVKQRWKDKAYKRYTVYLRKDTDQHLIDWLEANKERLGTTSVFRDGLEMYVNSEGRG